MMITEVFEIKSCPPQFDEERQRVLRLVGDAAPEAIVTEVGSTSIPGLLGKQDIDIAVIASQAAFNDIRQRFDAEFPRDAGQLSNDIYQAYVVDSFLDVKIQLTVRGAAHDTFNAFLDELRNHPNLVEAYNRLKTDWDGKPMQQYREAKALFIQRVIERSASS